MWSTNTFSGQAAPQQSGTTPATPTAGPKPAPPFAFGLEEGTPVPLTLARELSSAKEAPGNRVDFEVAQDITINHLVVIPKGSMAWGTIVEAKPKRRLGRAGKLDVRIDEVRLSDGERVPLRASQESKGKGRAGVMTGAIIGSGILFFPAAPLFLFMHGKDIVIAKGAAVTAYVDQNTALDPSKFSALAPTALAPVPASSTP
jgi:hypothetical protein